MTITTTHDPAGGGRPRLLFTLGEHPRAHVRHAFTAEEGRIFALPSTVTRIGSDPSNDLCLPGLAALHAEIHRNDADDYVLRTCSPFGQMRVHGRTATVAELHSGVRIELGPWVLSYARSEFADHGRPSGGRQGGELSAGSRIGA
jgi:hypothetical protein